MSHTRGGDFGQPPLQIKGGTAGLAICYEIAYPDLVRQLAHNSELLITLSNDTWFGHSIGPLQHMQMARMRAIENGRYLLRATNNGVTAIVDHRGRILGRLDQFVEGVLVGRFRLTTNLTLYTQTGNWPILALCLMVVLASRLYTPSSSRDKQ
jgi:apolipoprotein N-acyltransferase